MRIYYYQRPPNLLIYVIWLLISVVITGVVWATGLPLPFGTSVIQEEIAEVDGKENKVGIYEVRLNRERVIGFYKKELAKKGYNLFLEQENTAIFLKGNEICLVTATSFGEKTQFILSRSQRGNQLDGPAVCEEIVSVPVYPGAKCLRSMKMRSGRVHSVNYLISASIEEVLDFYQRNMPLKSWSLEQERDIGEPLSKEAFSYDGSGIVESLDTARQLVFKNHKGERCLILVMGSPLSRDTLITITHEKE